MRRAKIVATLGPATSSYENLRAIIDAGVDVARMNLSHGTYAVHEEIYAFEDLPRCMQEMHENGQTGIPIVRVAKELPPSVARLAT